MESEDPRKLVPYKTALVVIDMQKGFLNEHTAHLPAKIVELVESRCFGHVLYTQFFNGRGSPFRRILNWRKFTGDHDAALLDEIAEHAETVLSKGLYSCFSPEMLRWLGRHEEIDTLFFCGVDTDVCVLKSAVDAFELGYVPFVITDGCASHGGSEAHDAGLRVLTRMIGAAQLVDSDTVRKRLRAPRAFAQSGADLS